MKIKLVTDASSLLPLKLMEEENIGVFESILLIDGKEYRELTELNREEFILSLHDADPYPTSSQVSAQDVLDVYNKAIEDGFDEILYLSLTPKISSHMNVARLAAKRVQDKIKVTIYQTDYSCASQGAMVYHAMKLLKKGKSTDEIISYLDELKHKIHTVGVTVDLESLFKSGKVKRGSAKGILVSLLKMKPIVEITIEDAVIGIGAGISLKSAIKKLISVVETKTDSDTQYDLYMADTLNPELAKDLEQEIKKVRKIKETHHWEISPVVALSSGNGGVMATLCPVLEE